MKKFLFIINPKAGHGKAPAFIQRIQSYPVPQDIQFEIALTEYSGHAVQLAAEAVKNNFFAAIAVGGDGTVNEVARALIHSQTALGILPAGSGNGLARHLGYSMQPQKVLAQLCKAAVQKADTISINDFISVNVSGIGFDGYVAWLFNHAGKRGLSTYTTVALQSYAAYKSAIFRFESNQGLIEKEAHMLVMANASQFGNKACIAPSAKTDDGIMECVFVRKPPLYILPGFFFRLFSGTLKDSAWVQTVKCSTANVTISKPLHLHIDGESKELCSELKIRVHPLSLLLLKVK